MKKGQKVKVIDRINGHEFDIGEIVVYSGKGGQFYYLDGSDWWHLDPKEYKIVNDMTIQEALQKIEELKKFIEEKQLKVTKWPNEENGECYINNKWAFSLEEKDSEGILYLCKGNGTWYDKQENEVSGYLKFVPNEND